MTKNEELAYVLLTRAKALILDLGVIVVGDKNNPFDWPAELSAEFMDVCDEIEDLTTKMV